MRQQPGVLRHQGLERQVWAWQRLMPPQRGDEWSPGARVRARPCRSGDARNIRGGQKRNDHVRRVEAVRA